MRYTITILLIITAKTVLAQHVVGINMSNCDTSEHVVYMHRNHLISKVIVKDTLKLKIGLVRRCAFEPRIELDLKDDSLCIDIQNNLTSFHPCRCYRLINIDIIGVKDTSFTLFQKDIRKQGDTIAAQDGDLVLMNEKDIVEYTEIKTHPTKYNLPSISDIETATPDNHLSNDSLRVGSWVILDTITNIVQMKAHYFIDEKGRSIASWYVSYDEKGNLSEVCGCEGVNPEGYPSYICAKREEYLELKIDEQNIK